MNHKYPGYVKHGTLRTKVNDTSKLQIVRTMAHIDRIIDADNHSDSND